MALTADGTAPATISTTHSDAITLLTTSSLRRSLANHVIFETVASPRYDYDGNVGDEDGHDEDGHTDDEGDEALDDDDCSHAGCLVTLLSKRPRSGLPCSCYPNVVTSAPHYVCFPKSPQGFHLQAFLRMTFITTFVVPAH